jgi:hypothetical protein
MADDNVELKKTKYRAMVGVIAIICACIFLTSWVYGYFAFPSPKITQEEKQILNKLNELDKRVYELETFNKTLRVLVDIKQKLESN